MELKQEFVLREVALIDRDGNIIDRKPYVDGMNIDFGFAEAEAYALRYIYDTGYREVLRSAIDTTNDQPTVLM